MALTFGRTTPTALAYYLENYIKGSPFVCPADCIAEKLSGYISNESTAKNVKGAIYKTSDLSFVGETQIVNVPVTALTWIDFAFTAPKPSLTNGVNYSLVLWSAAGTGYSRLALATGFPANTSYNQSKVYTGWPATIDAASLAVQFCVYCTYSIPTNPYPTAWLKKGLVSGFHVFLNQYIKSKVLGYDPLKLPDGTLF